MTEPESMTPEPVTSEPLREEPEKKIAPDGGSPSPVLIVFLLIPLFGILTALAMVAADLRTQRLAATNADAPFITGNPATLVGLEAPAFELARLETEDLATLDDYTGDILFLNFWQTTCVPCIEELPDFAEFIEDQGDALTPVHVLAINFGETPGTVLDFFEEYGITGVPVAMDADSQTRRDYGVQGIPVTFVVGPDGVVNYTHIGALTYDQMQEYAALMRDPARVGDA